MNSLEHDKIPAIRDCNKMEGVSVVSIPKSVTVSVIVIIAVNVLLQHYL